MPSQALIPLELIPMNAVSLTCRRKLQDRKSARRAKKLEAAGTGFAAFILLLLTGLLGAFTIALIGTAATVFFWLFMLTVTAGSGAYCFKCTRDTVLALNDLRDLTVTERLRLDAKHEDAMEAIARLRNMEASAWNDAACLVADIEEAEEFRKGLLADREIIAARLAQFNAVLDVYKLRHVPAPRMLEAPTPPTDP